MLSRFRTGAYPAALILLAGASVLSGAAAQDQAKDTRLAEAAMQGDRDAVRSLIAQHASVNAAQGDGMTALHWAAFKNDMQMAGMLLAAGADVKAGTRIGGLTPLAMACTNGNAGMVQALLQAGADPNAANSVNGQTVLMLAAASGSADAVEALLAHGANVNAKETANEETALMFAAAEDRGAAIKVLAAHGADLKAASKIVSLTRVKALDDNGNPIPVKAPAPPKAIPTGNTSTATVMGGMTALLFAARDGRLDAIRALVEAGADVNEGNSEKTPPIVMAITNAHFDAGKYLLDHGANPNLANEDGLTALYATVDAQYAPLSWAPVALTTQEKIQYLDLMKALLSRGADPNARLGKVLWYRPTSHSRAWINPQGGTAFWRAAAAHDAEAMKLLVAHGADPSIASAQKDTPLMVAAGVGWAGGNVSQGSPVPGSWMAAIRLCVELGLDVNAKDIQGYTALHGAASRGDNEMIQFLVDHGARIDVKSKNGLALTDMANGLVEYFGDSLPLPFPETVAFLEKLGAPSPEACTETCGDGKKVFLRGDRPERPAAGGKDAAKSAEGTPKDAPEPK